MAANLCTQDTQNTNIAIVMLKKENMSKPNFFIVGAPKCGTTALAAYLGDHPQVFMSTPKEPHYFADDFPGYQFSPDLDGYLSLFLGANSDARVVGEASVYYLYSKTAVANIKAYDPDARLVAMLRNPVDMVHSLHAQLLFTLNENEPDFMTAWGRQGDRLAGKFIPKYCKDSAMLQYQAVASYTEQLKRLYKHFPKEQVKVILFDDFKDDVRQVYEDVLDFLTLDSDRRTSFDVVNASHVRRSKLISVLLRAKPKPIRQLWAMVKKHTGATAETGQKIGRWLEKSNTRYQGRESLTKDERAIIAASFMEEINMLENLLDRSFESWRS
ncbi:MAG: sulfotransferase domain-containing protein [Candidatus Thiodiazotropha sp. (ex Lucinoma borealis)]|nr:sulfotransferase domain-containing protein [Candidatus Thiodiazotropha sp. (ex Lucinoma borealis)]